MYSVERETSPTDLEHGARSLELNEGLDDHAYMNDDVQNSLDRQRSSITNLSEYARMSGDSAHASPPSYPDSKQSDGEYSYPHNFELFPLLNGGTAVPPVQNGAKLKLVKTSSIPNVLDGNPGASVAAGKNGIKMSPSLQKIKLVKTSSTPTALDDNPRVSPVIQSRANKKICGDDYVPASPPSATISHRSGSGLGTTGSNPASPPTPASGGIGTSLSHSPSVVSQVAGVSMSSRSRVFTRQK